MGHLTLRVLGLLGLLALIGCGGGDEGPAPTTVTVAYAAAPDVNGSRPARMQVLYLTGTSAFTAASFFDVSGDPQAALGPELVRAEEVFLQPNGTGQRQQSFPAGGLTPTHVGVVVGFRDINTAQWQAVKALVPNAQNVVQVAIGSASVTLQ